MKKEPFVTKTQLDEIVKEYPTPFHLYDEKGFGKCKKALKEAFAWNKGYKEYFCSKGDSKPIYPQYFKEYGCGCDCSSYTELLMSESIGQVGENIMFSSNDTPAEEFTLAISSARSSTWTISHTLIFWKRRSERFRRRSAAVIIRVDFSKFPTVLWIIREMPNTV